MKRQISRLSVLALAIVMLSAPRFAYAAEQVSSPKATSSPVQASSHDDKNKQWSISGPYRLIYTLTEMDGTKRVGSQRYSIVVDASTAYKPAHLRLGTKIPITTGESTTTLPSQSQIQYIDIGMSIESTLRPLANGLELESHVNQSAIDSQQSLVKDPVIRQTSLDTSVLLSESKPLTIGSVDIPGSTHILEIQVEVRKLP